MSTRRYRIDFEDDKGNKQSVHFDVQDGYTPVKGTDYWTEADQEAIVQQTVTAIGSPENIGAVSVSQGVANAGKILIVDANGNLTLSDIPFSGTSGDIVGVIDADNNIVLTGVLPEGIYTFKYQMEDGTLQDVGSINLESEQVVSVALHYGKIDYSNNGAIVSSDTYLYSDAVERETNCSYRVSYVGEGSNSNFKVCYYDENDNYLSVSDIAINPNNGIVQTGSWSVPLIAGAAKFRLRIYHTSNAYTAATLANFVLTKQRIKYTNQLALSTDESGNVLNGVGYKDGYRFSSYGGDLDQDGAVSDFFVTGFIPYTNQQAKDRVPFYIKGITLDLTSLPNYLRFCFCAPGSTEWVGQCTLSDANTDEINKFTITQLGDNYYMFKPNPNVYTYQAWNTKSLAHARWCLPGTGAGVIITVDEPIE